MLAMLMLLLAFAGCGPDGADTTQPPADNTGTPATQPAGEQELQGEIHLLALLHPGPPPGDHPGRRRSVHGGPSLA